MSNRQQLWPGHYPITLYALEAISKKWSDHPDTDIPRTERLLYVVCAFRAALAMDTLIDFFSGEMIHRLQKAREACAEIGANAAATVLQRHLDDLAEPTDELTAAPIVAGIQSQLACWVDDMDELIAQYAADRVRDGFLPG